MNPATVRDFIDMQNPRPETVLLWLTKRLHLGRVRFSYNVRFGRFEAKVVQHSGHGSTPRQATLALYHTVRDSLRANITKPRR